MSARRSSRSHRRKASAKKRSAPRRRENPRISLTQRDRSAGQWFAKLVALQARLRGLGGCPWDREQTHESLRKFLIEETYEALDAMESPDPHKFASELGDLLLQIVFHAILAEETGRFDISDVIESIHSKMVRRHPHVFGDVTAKTSADVLKNWEQLKAQERSSEQRPAGPSQTEKAARESILAGVPQSLPGVLEAYQLTRRAAHIGFDWEDLAGIFEKLDEEKRELQSIVAARSVKASGATGSDPQAAPAPRNASSQKASTEPALSSLEEEVGDLLFVAVNVARFLGVDPEIALKKANRKFKRRFEWMETEAQRGGGPLADVSRSRMEELWNESKAKT